MEVPQTDTEIDMRCRCCLTSDSTFMDMHSAKFQSKDQLLILGYKDLIGEPSTLPNKEFDACSFICMECLEQLETAISFREQCLQARGLLCKSSNDESAPAKCIPVVRRRAKRQPRKTHHCALCPGIYTSKGMMVKHMKQHKENAEDPTKKAFENFFAKYKGTFGESNVIKCPECDKIFKTVVEFNRHVQKHINFKPFKCSFPSCSSEYKFEKDFQDHLKVHEEGLTVKCPNCPKHFSGKKSLNYHLKVHHRPEEETVWYACDVCGKKYTYTYQLFKHVFVHKDHNPFHCPVCSLSTSDKVLFKRHLKEHDIDYDEKIHGYVESESHKLPKKEEVKEKRKRDRKKRKNQEFLSDYEESDESVYEMPARRHKVR